MIQKNPQSPSGSIVYPESDGKPMADNTKQARWIVVLYGNLCLLFRDQDVFVAADLFWYPVEGNPEEVTAPDVFVVLRRPKGDRSSYRQWEEENVPVTVAFEILSPSNTISEIDDKLFFYEQHGVQEYYVYDPDTNRLMIYLRRGQTLVRDWFGKVFVSPSLGIRFDLTGPELVISHPNGRRFLTFEELESDRQREQQQRELAQQQAEKAQQRAEKAQQQAEKAQQRAERAEQRAARITELSRKALRNLASPEEMAELERLFEEGPPS